MVTVEANGHHDVSDLVEMYRSKGKSPVDFGRRILAYRRKHGISQQALARLTGITPGTLHHYESLQSLAPSLIAAVEAGKLNFKEGRSLADLYSHERQVEIAGPFLSGSLSSVYIEVAVRIAKAKPNASVDEVITLVFATLKAKPNGWPSAIRKPVTPVMAVADEVTRRMLDLAALLTPLASTPYPEITTMRLRQTARILVDRLQAAKLA